MRMRAVLCSVVVASSLTAVPAAAETYRTQPGDTVSGIAEDHGVSVSALLSVNRLPHADRIIAGQVLVIPSRSGTGGPAAASGGRTHRVAQGEVLSTIAARYGLSTSALAAVNGITNTHMVRAGQLLRLDGAGAPAAAGPRTYVVEPGDVLSAVARRLGTTTGELLRLNGLADADRIRIGQVLNVPNAGSSGRSGPSTRTASAGSGSAASAVRRYPNMPSRLRANPDRLALVPNFERWAAHYGLPVEFLMAVTYLESGWQNTVVSHKAAVGIGQLMPDTSRWLADEIIRIPSLDPNVADDNIRMTAAFLSWLQRAMGSRERAIAAYYQGPTSVSLVGPYPVTDVYVTAVSSLINSFRPA